MAKIKEFYLKTFNSIRKLFKVYPLTMMFVVFTTLFATLVLDFVDSEICLKILFFLVTQSVGMFFAESTFKSDVRKMIAYFSTAIMTSVFTFYIWSDVNEIIMEQILYGYFAYVSALTLISVYSILINSKLKFKEYLFNVFVNILKSSITYAILALGISLICGIFIALIFDGENYDIIFKANLLIFGIYYVPALIRALSNVNREEENSFIKGIVKYVLLPLVSIAFVVIYIYIIKIFVLRQIPSNVIFRILLSLFVLAFPVWNMAEIFEENKIVHKTARILPYAFIPFILLEAYSIGIRIAQFGITPIRYIGLVVLFMQIVALIFTLVKDRKYLSHLSLAVAIILFITCTTITPHRVARISQRNIILRNMPEGTQFSDLSNSAKEKVKSAYTFFEYNDYNKYIPEYAVAFEEDITNYHIDSNYIEARRKYVYLEGDRSVNVVEYTRFSKAFIINVKQKDSKIICNLQYSQADNTYSSMEIDMTDYINDIIKKYNETEDEKLTNYLPKIDEIIIDENKVFHIASVNLAYETETSKIDYIDIEGYLLEK